MRRATLGALPALSVAVLSACAAGEVPATVLDAIPEAWHLTPPPPLPEKGSGFGTLKAFAFKSDAEGWSASPGVELSVSEPGVLRIKGAERKNLWTFASLPSVDVPPGRFVLLRFEYRIESADAETYSPHVWLGQYGFETKDGKQEKVRRATCRTPDLPLFPLGEWRAMDLEIPPDAKAAKLEASLSKGVREPRSVDLSIRNVALLLTPRPASEWRIKSTPAPDAFKRDARKHPRLFFDSAQWNALRFGAQDSLKVASDHVLSRVHGMISSGPRDYTKFMADPQYQKDTHQQWQVPTGDAIPTLAVAYALKGDKKALDSAVAHIHASCGYPQWGLEEYNGIDWAAARQLQGLALGYDWLYDKLDEKTRARIRATVRQRAGLVARRLAMRNIPGADDPLSLRRAILCGALFQCALAFREDEPEAPGWLYLAHELLLETLAALGPDGGHPHGAYAWQTAAEQLMRWADLAHAHLGIDVFSHPWFAASRRFGMHTLLPGALRNQRPHAVGFAGNDTSCDSGPDHVLRALAKRFSDPAGLEHERAQWLATELAKAYTCQDHSVYLNFPWSGLQVRERPPDRDPPLPTLAHFADLDWVVARSEWTSEATVLSVRAGPPLGHRAFGLRRDFGLGQNEPDCGAPLLYGFGENALRIPDDRRDRKSADSNVMLFGGMGQLGENVGRLNYQPWQHAPRAPRIERAVSKPEADLIVMDLAPAYPAQAGLTKYRRSILYLKPDIAVVLDEASLAQPLELQWNWHTQGYLIEQDGRWSSEGERAGLDLAVLEPSNAAVEALADVRLDGQSAVQAGRKRLISIKTAAPAAEGLGLIVFRVRPVSPWDFPPPFGLRRQGNELELESEKRRWKVTLAPGADEPLSARSVK
ncbi:MAG: hypothetical protein AMXMBFR7_38810 [Planctomycetota bacterium]